MEAPEVFKQLKSPFVMIIFGATGDLTRTKLIPGLFSLYKEKMLPADFSVIGFSRRNLDDGEFASSFENLRNQEGWGEFAEHVYYQTGTFEQDEGYQKLIEKLKRIDERMGVSIKRFFYLATPPKHYSEILDQIVNTKISKSDSSIIVEKPFGKDLETAKMLEMKLSESFEEKQIFRVDHYLGKETVQNMLAFRFANSIFEPIWNSKFIDHVQISWGEIKGVEGRGAFFEGVGILRDFLQNHVMQLIAAVAMEQPRSFTKEDLRDARAKLIGSIRNSGEAVRGQYEGYKNEKDVSPTSNTETFVAAKLFVDTPRFKGVPFYLRVGKKMPKDLVEISVVFIQTCHILFKEYGCPEIGNVITFRIQPNEGISLRFIAKKPGAKLALEPVNMKFNYEEGFGTTGLDAYEKILLDIFAGDQILFSRSDEIENSWSLLDEVLKKWQKEKTISTYPEGIWGPAEANELIEKDGRHWIT